MEKNKQEFFTVISMLEKIYGALSKEGMGEEGFSQMIPVVVKLCKNLQPLYRDNQSFETLIDYLNQLVSDAETGQLDSFKRYILLNYLQQFEVSLMKEKRFRLYLYNCKIEDVPINKEHMKTVTELTQNSMTSFQMNTEDISVFIYAGQDEYSFAKHMDLSFQIESLLNVKDVFYANLNVFDYYKYDRMYLETKLESLKNRPDIRLLLAGSSYTMCGLFESDMPLPARNVAVNAQDLYYSMKSIRTALEYNSNITHCILSFAYYLWGTDLSLSTSLYQYSLIKDINYPIFKDRHNFKGYLAEDANHFLGSITPLKKYLFPFEKWTEQKEEEAKKSLADAHYFSYPRIESETLKHDDETNHKFAKQRTESHNKFFKYHETVQENQKLFEEFLKEMNERNIEILLYVPPVTDYYRNHIHPDLISNFYHCMKPLQGKYSFTLIDLFDSDKFHHSDFFDYDHLNDQGAKKLGEILGNEIKKSLD